MKIVGLTGSIGMGKTTTAAMFHALGVPVWDADGAVHRLYASGGSGVASVSIAFPESHRDDGSIDRDILARSVLDVPEKLRLLESIVHPLVGQDRAQFLAQAREMNVPIVIIDVPLLFETGGDAHVDDAIVVTCEAVQQRQRVLMRPGMTEAKLTSILSRQLPDAEKRARADFIITTDISLDDTREQVGRVYHQLLLT